MVELPEVMGEVYRAFEVGISKVTSLEADRLEGIKGAFRLAVDELLVNATCYGLAGLTSKQRVEAYIEFKEDPALTAAIDKRLQDSEVRERRGLIVVEVFPDRAVLTVCDGTPFSDFSERWEGANDALLEENLERLSGRGFLLLRSYGFSAEQTAAGAVVYTLKLAE